MKVVHCKKEPYDVYIGRPGPYGNKYSHKAIETTCAEEWKPTREECIAAYERDLRTLLELEPDFVINEFLRPIAGKTLGCWCAPKPCHGDVLIKLCKELGLLDGLDR